MPAVAERLKQNYPWNPKLADPNLAVAKGAALYAAGQTVRFVESAAEGGQSADTAADPAARLVPGPVTSEAVQVVAERTGLTEEQVEKFAKKTVVNVLPKAVGIKLLDTSKPNWEDDPHGASYIKHVIAAQTQLPYQAGKFTPSTAVAYQESIGIEIWEQAGALPDRALSANHRVDDAGVIEGLAPFALPAGSPVDITMGVDAEGTVSLVAVEPTSGKELKMSVRISVLSGEQLAEAKANVASLALST